MFTFNYGKKDNEELCTSLLRVDESTRDKLIERVIVSLLTSNDISSIKCVSSTLTSAEHGGRDGWPTYIIMGHQYDSVGSYLKEIQDMQLRLTTTYKESSCRNHAEYCASNRLERHASVYTLCSDMVDWRDSDFEKLRQIAIMSKVTDVHLILFANSSFVPDDEVIRVFDIVAEYTCDKSVYICKSPYDDRGVKAIDLTVPDSEMSLIKGSETKYVIYDQLKKGVLRNEKGWKSSSVCGRLCGPGISRV